MHTHLLEEHNHYLCRTLYCTSVFRTMAECDKHFKDVHDASDVLNLTCGECGKVFIRRGHLEEHMLSHVAESERDVFSSPEPGCKSEFAHEHDLQCYMKGHEQEGWKCLQCNFVTAEKHNLKQHIVQQHEQPSLPCRAGCFQKFKTRDAHLRHEKTHK